MEAAGGQALQGPDALRVPEEAGAAGRPGDQVAEDRQEAGRDRPVRLPELRPPVLPSGRTGGSGEAAAGQVRQDRHRGGQAVRLDKLTAGQKAELAAGMKSGLEKIKRQVATFGKDENGWRVGLRLRRSGVLQGRLDAAGGGGDGRHLRQRCGRGAVPLLATDSEGNKPDCSKNRYTLTFPKGQLPPVNAFWSVTMYDGKTQLLIENPINRYLINSPMLPDLKKNDDGSLTLYIQKDSPGKEKESNWLPAPDGPIYVVMRLYWPKEEALKGEWKPPAVVRANW